MFFDRHEGKAWFFGEYCSSEEISDSSVSQENFNTNFTNVSPFIWTTTSFSFFLCLSKLITDHPTDTPTYCGRVVGPMDKAFHGDLQKHLKNDIYMTLCIANKSKRFVGSCLFYYSDFKVLLVSFCGRKQTKKAQQANNASSFVVFPSVWFFLEHGFIPAR